VGQIRLAGRFMRNYREDSRKERVRASTGAGCGESTVAHKLLNGELLNVSGPQGTAERCS
jgi:hypothetical protein